MAWSCGFGGLLPQIYPSLLAVNGGLALFYFHGVTGVCSDVMVDGSHHSMLHYEEIHCMLVYVCTFCEI